MPISKLFWLAAAAGIFSLFVVSSPGRIAASDVGSRLILSRQIWTKGDVFSPGDLSTEGLVYLPEKNASTSLYGIGQSLLLVPFDWLGVQLARLVSVSSDRVRDVEGLPIHFFYVPLVGTLWWLALCQVLLQCGIPRKTALGFTLLFGLSTILWFYSSQSTQEEAPVSLMLICAFGMALQWKRDQRSRWAFGAGALAAFSLTIRLSSVFGVLPILGVLLDSAWENKKTWRAFLPKAILYGLAGALPILALQGAFAYWRFGSPFSTGYDIARLRGMGVFWGPVDAIQIVRLVLGPGKGLLFLSPPLLIALWGWRPWLRQQPFVAASTAVALLCSLVVCSKILNNPEGSESWGARYQVHLLGFLILPFFLGWRSLAEKGYRRGAIALVALGIAIQFCSSYAPTGLEYFQVKGDRIRREQITSSFTQGQLPLRLSNLWAWAQGKSRISTVVENDLRPLFAYTEAHYVPNFWGAVYSRKLGTSLPWIFSSILLLFGISALSFALKPTP